MSPWVCPERILAETFYLGVYTRARQHGGDLSIARGRSPLRLVFAGFRLGWESGASVGAGRDMAGSIADADAHPLAGYSVEGGGHPNVNWPAWQRWGAIGWQLPGLMYRLQCSLFVLSCASLPSSHPVPVTLKRNQSRAEAVESLRRLLPRMEGIRADGDVLSFSLPGLDEHLPLGGLAFGALHEVAPEATGDLPTAFGFVAALLSRMPQRGPQDGPVLLIVSRRGLADYGRPHGHGLNALGLDPARVILVETVDERQALWTMEEALRSGAPAAVAGAIGTGLDLKTSQRLQLAARTSSLPLLLLRPAGAMGTSAAATRWRIGAVEAARDRFGLVARWRWRVQLERCRNGRPGEWLVEWDHVAHRFSLAAAVADPALYRSSDTRPLIARAG
jgi:protein ImuA